jgi:hypothetical protein
MRRSEDGTANGILHMLFSWHDLWCDMACDLAQAVFLITLTVGGTPQGLILQNLCEDTQTECGRTAAAVTRDVELVGPFAMELYAVFQRD